MSTAVMAKCWPLQGMSPAQKAVLMSLADNANDDGVCWPSVSTICMRTCLSERPVQAALRWLVDAGLIVREERRGSSNVYKIHPEAYQPPHLQHPRISSTPAANAEDPRISSTPPPHFQHPTPAFPAPRTVKEPIKNRKEPSGAPKAAPISAPSGVSPKVWADFTRYRKAKKAEVTETYVETLEREFQKAEAMGWVRDDVLAETMAAGWQGVKADWLQKRGNPRAAQTNTTRGVVI